MRAASSPAVNVVRSQYGKTRDMVFQVPATVLQVTESVLTVEKNNTETIHHLTDKLSVRPTLKHVKPAIKKAILINAAEVNELPPHPSPPVNNHSLRLSLFIFLRYPLSSIQCPLLPVLSCRRKCSPSPTWNTLTTSGSEHNPVQAPLSPLQHRSPHQPTPSYPCQLRTPPPRSKPPGRQTRGRRSTSCLPPC